MTRFNELGKLLVVMGILFVLGAGFALYKIVQTGELSFAVITTYDSDYCNGSTTAYC